jgi:sugar lactone lactonase YvrE
LTVDRAGNVVVADYGNHAIRSLTKEGAVVSTLAGGRLDNDDENDEENVEERFGDGQGANARFKCPGGVVVAANGDIFVSDRYNHAIRVLTPQGAVRTLCGNGQAGFADAQGADARFNYPCGLALDAEENLLVADSGNNAIRRVTMAGAVSTVAGNGEAGFADGAGAGARFDWPTDVVVDGEGAIVVADKNNHRLRKIVGGQVTTLAGSSEPGTADGAGAVARFNFPIRLALDERGRLLVAEVGRKDTLRVVEASLAPPLWMGPVEEAVVTVPAKAHAALVALQQDCFKMVGDSELADVVLVVKGERFPAHRVMLAGRSEYFRGLLLSGMEGGRSESGGVQEIELGGGGSAGALRELEGVSAGALH